MGKRIIITGATGMIGGIILKKCIDDKAVSSITTIGRRKANIKHPKLNQIITDDFTNLDEHETHFRDIDCSFFCLGVYTGAVPNDKFKEITVDYTLRFGKFLQMISPSAIFCLLSGAGADRSEKSKTPFAKYKGMAENGLSDLNFKQFYAFRPGYIYPVKKRKEPNMMYNVIRVLYPIIKLMGKNTSITSVELANAMYAVLSTEPNNEILENRDILKLTAH